ncbi:MAG: triple tyrosine motif-containing protein [Bacteroidota bacterium]
MEWDSLDNRYNLPVSLSLPHDKNYLQFHFAQAHMGTQDTVWYRYILEGIDKKWSEKTYKISSENYPEISPGTYTFKVSSLFNGKWCTPVAYTFTIKPPWWTTLWAYALYVLIGIGLLRMYIAYRSRRLQMKIKYWKKR